MITQPPNSYIAELNIAKARFALDAPEMAAFAQGIETVNAIAERSEGYIWRLKGAQEDGGVVPAQDDPRLLINLSVWATPRHLQNYFAQTLHKKFFTRREAWFEPMDGPHFVMWWIEKDHRPTIDEAFARLEKLTKNGPTPEAFGWSDVTHRG